MPVEVVGSQAGQHAHTRGDGHVGRLVGGDLHHVGVGRRPVRSISVTGTPMFPMSATSSPSWPQDGRGQGGGRALALGAGDRHHPGVGEVLEPQGHGRGDRHPRRARRRPARGGTGSPRGPAPPRRRRPTPPGRGGSPADRPTEPIRRRACSGRSSIRSGTTPAFGQQPAMARPSLPDPPHAPPVEAHSSSRFTTPPVSTRSTAAAMPGSGKASVRLRGSAGRRRRRPTPGPGRRGQGAHHRPCPRHRGSSERIRRAAADSRRSPTHSKGLSSSLIRAANPGT